MTLHEMVPKYQTIPFSMPSTINQQPNHRRFQIRAWYGCEHRAQDTEHRHFKFKRANGVIFRSFQNTHNTIQTPFKYHVPFEIKIVHRIEILHGWKILLNHNGFQIVIAILYYIIQWTKSIQRYRMRSDVSYVNVSMVNSEQTCLHFRYFWMFALSMLERESHNYATAIWAIFFANSFSSSFWNQKWISLDFLGWIAGSIIIVQASKFS